jgi:hypothetical protein
MSVLYVFITSQNLVVQIIHSSADRVSSETIGFVPKYSLTICRDYSESFDQISSERRIRLSSRCQSVHCLTCLACLHVMSVFLWSQSRTFLSARGANVFSDGFFNAGRALNVFASSAMHHSGKRSRAQQKGGTSCIPSKTDRNVPQIRKKTLTISELETKFKRISEF